MMLLTTNQSQKDLAKVLGVSDWTVRRVITNLDGSFKTNYRWLPCHIAFDDFKSGKMAPSGMSMILMNIANHQALDIILSRRNRYLRNYFLHYDRSTRLAVQTVTVDLYTPYRLLIHELFPHAIIIADYFHVVAQAYRYYQDLIFAVSQRSRHRLNQLLTTKLTILPKPLQRVQRTLRQHKKEILHSFKYTTYTNGPVEGTNNKIKVIKRVAYGFRNFDYFRIRILLALPNTYIAINWKISKQPVPKFRHELLNEIILFSCQYFLTKSHFLELAFSLLNGK